MNVIAKTTIFLTCAFVVSAVSIVSAQEQRVTEAQLPPAIATVFAKQAAGAKVLGYAREIEKGRTYYELSLQLPGQNRDVLVDTAGTVVEIEETVAFDSLPPAVQDALRAKASRTPIEAVERLIKRGRLVAYEGHLGQPHKGREVQVGPRGESLAHEE